MVPPLFLCSSNVEKCFIYAVCRSDHNAVCTHVIHREDEFPIGQRMSEEQTQIKMQRQIHSTGTEILTAHFNP